MTTTVIKTKIAPVVSKQMPEFVKDEYPAIVKFLESYYEWMELEGNPGFVLRNIEDLTDIDNTVDDYIEYFKKEVMQDIPEVILANKRLLAKHIREFYSAKGTIKSYELLFRILYGDEVEIYYPKDDMLKVSAGNFNVAAVIKGLSQYGNAYNITGQIIYQPTVWQAQVGVYENQYIYTSNRLYKIVSAGYLGTQPPSSLDPSVTENNGSAILQFVSNQLPILPENNYTAASAAVELITSYVIGGETIYEIILQRDSIDGEFLIDKHLIGLDTTNNSYSILTSIGFIPYVEVTNGGKYYNGGETFSIYEGDGLGFSSEVSTVGRGSISEIFVEEPGDGYVIGQLIDFDTTNSGGTGSYAKVADLDRGSFTLETSVVNPPEHSWNASYIGNYSGTDLDGTSLVNNNSAVVANQITDYTVTNPYGAAGDLAIQTVAGWDNTVAPGDTTIISMYAEYDDQVTSGDAGYPVLNSNITSQLTLNIQGVTATIAQFKYHTNFDNANTSLTFSLSGFAGNPTAGAITSLSQTWNNTTTTIYTSDSNCGYYYNNGVATWTWGTQFSYALGPFMFGAYNSGEGNGVYNDFSIEIPYYLPTASTVQEINNNNCQITSTDGIFTSSTPIAINVGDYIRVYDDGASLTDGRIIDQYNYVAKIYKVISVDGPIGARTSFKIGNAETGAPVATSVGQLPYYILFREQINQLKLKSSYPAVTATGGISLGEKVVFAVNCDSVITGAQNSFGSFSDGTYKNVSNLNILSQSSINTTGWLPNVNLMTVYRAGGMLTSDYAFKVGDRVKLSKVTIQYEPTDSYEATVYKLWVYEGSITNVATDRYTITVNYASATNSISSGNTSWQDNNYEMTLAGNITTGIGVGIHGAEDEQFIGYDTSKSVGFWQNGDAFVSNGNYFNATSSFTSGNKVYVAVDRINHKMWIRVNLGYWNNNPSANPGTNTGGYSISSLSSNAVIYPIVNPYYSNRISYGTPIQTQGKLTWISNTPALMPFGFDFIDTNTGISTIEYLLSESGNKILPENDTEIFGVTAAGKGIGGIRKVSVINEGYSYSALPEVTCDSYVGDNAKLVAIGKNIGRITDVGIPNMGVNYTEVPYIIPRVKAIITRKYEGLGLNQIDFLEGEPVYIDKEVLLLESSEIGERILLETNSGGGFILAEDYLENVMPSGVVESYDSNLQLITIRLYNNSSATLNSFESNVVIVGQTSNAKAKIIDMDHAVLTPEIRGIGEQGGKFVDTSGMLSEVTKHLTDSYYYQEFSYVIKAGLSIDQYRSVVKKLLHPVGLALFGQINIKVLIDAAMKRAGVNENTDAITKHLVSSDNVIPPPAYADNTTDILIHKTVEDHLVFGPKLSSLEKFKFLYPPYEAGVKNSLNVYRDEWSQPYTGTTNAGYWESGYGLTRIQDFKNIVIGDVINNSNKRLRQCPDSFIKIIKQ